MLESALGTDVLAAVYQTLNLLWILWKAIKTVSWNKTLIS